MNADRQCIKQRFLQFSIGQLFYYLYLSFYIYRNFTANTEAFCANFIKIKQIFSAIKSYQNARIFDGKNSKLPQIVDLSGKIDTCFVFFLIH